MIRIILLFIFAWVLPSPAAHAQITTTLQGLNINTVAFEIAVPAGTLALPMRTRATDRLKSVLNWQEPDAAASTSTLVLDLSTTPVTELPGKVLKQWSLRLVEGTTIRGFSHIVYTYDRHGGMGIAPAPTQDDLNQAIDDFMSVFIQAYQIGNGLPITPSGPSLTLNGSGNMFTLNVQNAVPGVNDCITVDKTDWSNGQNHAYFSWVTGSTMTGSVTLSPGVWAANYWKACGAQPGLFSSPAVTVQ